MPLQELTITHPLGELINVVESFTHHHPTDKTVLNCTNESQALSRITTHQSSVEDPDKVLANEPHPINHAETNMLQSYHAVSQITFIA